MHRSSIGLALTNGHAIIKLFKVYKSAENNRFNKYLLTANNPGYHKMSALFHYKGKCTNLAG